MIDYEFQDLFLKQDIDKQLLIEYDTGTITNNEIQSEQFTLEESLCSESNLRFGCCESSSVKFTVLNIFEPLKNKWLDISMVLAGNVSNPFKIGRFKVYSDVPTADRKIREITAYDALYDIINADVAEWYDTILPEKNSTVTLKQFRNSFFMYFGIEQEATELPNDGMTVEKTIEPEQLSGKTVVSAICEINGCFGHINRNGKFAYVFLRPLTKGLYPSTTLYPANDLYPSEPNSQRIGTGRYISAQYEDYEVEKITKLQIRQEENDIGVVVGDGENAYIIQDNFLAYGKDLDILQGIAQNVFEKIRNIFYRPFSAKAKGNPCFELGDGISLSTKTAIIDSYILERTLSGVQALRDNYTANGEQTQDAGVNSLSNSIIQLKGKTNKLTRNLEETKLEMSDMEAGLSNTITITAQSLQTEIKDTKNGLQSQITQNAGSISSEIARAKDAESTLSTKITQTDESIRSDVSATYETKTNAGKQYTALSSSITQTASDITAEVKRAKDAENELSASIKVNAEKIESKVSNGNVSSVISQEAGVIAIKSNRISIDSTYFQLTKDGKITATSVEVSGKLTATSGTIGGFTIGSAAIYSGSKSSLSSSMSGVYLGTDGIALGTNFKVGTDGKLTATGAELSGKITATSGTIGGFTIGSAAIYSGSKSSLSSTIGGVYIGTDGISLGSKFKINTSGEITSTGGSIAGFTIGDSKIYSGLKSSLSNSMSGVYLGTDGIALGTNFKVGTDGKLTATSGTIGGFTITTNSLNTNSKQYLESGSGVLLNGSGIGFGTSTLDFTWIDSTGFHTKYSTSGFITSIRHIIGGSAGYAAISCGNHNVVLFNENGSKLSGDCVRVGDTKSKLSFFDDMAPTSSGGSAKQIVANISNTSSATSADIAKKLNDLLTALRNYGLIS